MVNNGLVIFRVEQLEGSNALCRVVAGGELSDRKSMNFPNRVLAQAFLSQQDREDLLFGIQNGVDFVAASFVSNRQDMEDLRTFLDENGGSDIDIIAKIENRSGVDHIEEICQIADGVMVARGTWVWKFPSWRFRPFRSTSSTNAASWVSGSSLPRRCWNP